MASLNNLMEKGKLEGDAILMLSRFIMETRASKSKAATDLIQELQANAESADFARKQLAELSSGSSRLERDAVIVIQKARPEAGTVRLGHLVGAATWRPQYRLRGTADDVHLSGSNTSPPWSSRPVKHGPMSESRSRPPARRWTPRLRNSFR